MSVAMVLWGVESPSPGELFLKLKLVHEKHFFPSYLSR